MREAGASPVRNVIRRVVNAKVSLIVVLVERNETRESLRHPGVPMQRRVFRFGQQQASDQAPQQRYPDD